jgi:hypothetical protein
MGIMELGFMNCFPLNGLNLCWFFYLPNGVSISQFFIEQCLQGEHDLFCLCTPNKTVVIGKSQDQISIEKTAQESVTTYI